MKKGIVCAQCGRVVRRVCSNCWECDKCCHCSKKEKRWISENIGKLGGSKND